jgi:hypothetical protein
VHLRIFEAGKLNSEQSQQLNIPGFGQIKVALDLHIPEKPGQYTVIASLEKPDEEQVKSIREIQFVTK